MNHHRHGRLLFRVMLLCAATVAWHPVPSAAQREASIGVTGELVDVMVSALAADPDASGMDDTRRLLDSLLDDALVVSVLQDAGAAVSPSPSFVPTAAGDLARLQEVLAGGAPLWLADAIQVSVEMELPAVTPLSVLLVLVRDPDVTVTTFLRELGVEADALEAGARSALQEMATG